MPALARCLLFMKHEPTRIRRNCADPPACNPLVCKQEALAAALLISSCTLSDVTSVTKFRTLHVGLLLICGALAPPRIALSQETPASLDDLLEKKVGAAQLLSIARVIP